MAPLDSLASATPDIEARLAFRTSMLPTFGAQSFEEFRNGTMSAAVALATRGKVMIGAPQPWGSLINVRTALDFVDHLGPEVGVG